MKEVDSPNPADTIITNMNAETVPDSCVELSLGQSHLSVRERGCFIVDCSLVSPTTGELIPVMYSDGKIDVPKINASHIMSPVGPNKELGGQHGFARWADFYPKPQGDYLASSKSMTLETTLVEDTRIVKTFSLLQDRLLSETELQNVGLTPQHTSIGEHMYFSLLDEDVAGLKINGKSIDELLEQKGAALGVTAGESIFWPGYDGKLTVELPGGYAIDIESAAFLESDEIASIDISSHLGMLIWHRPGTNSICLEPTLGYSKSDNRLLVIKPNATVSLQTEIKLL